MNSTTVTLGGVAYTVDELPARKNSQWRAGFEEQLGPILNLVAEAGAGAAIASSDDLMRIAHSVGRVLVKSPDTVTELLFCYAPTLEAARDLILDTAYDSELIGAFQAILGLAYPFGGLARQMASLASGSPKTGLATTSKNSPSRNGVTPAKASTSLDG